MYVYAPCVFMRDFLGLMLFFAVGLCLLKFKRPTSPKKRTAPVEDLYICMCMCVHTLYVHSGLPGAVRFFAVVSVCSSSSA